jgi:hypothetical protein
MLGSWVQGQKDLEGRWLEVGNLLAEAEAEVLHRIVQQEKLSR